MLKQTLGLLTLALITTPSWARTVDVAYHVKFLPAQDSALVTIQLADGAAVPNLVFNFEHAERYSEFNAQGAWQLEDNRGIWQPTEGKASLSYQVKISQQDKKRFSEKITPDWLLMQGDSLVPPTDIVILPKVHLVSRVQFELPKEWRSIETAWKRVGPNTFRIDDVQTGFDRPTGWIIAGKLGSRRDKLGETEVTVAAPLAQHVRRMDMLTLMNYIWPQLQAAFPRDPQKLLVVSAGDEMQKQAQGLAQSFYVSGQEALVSENGASDLIKELVLAFTQFSSAEDEQWIGQGMAYYYSLELLLRSGGITLDRYTQTLEKWKADSKATSHLRGELNEDKLLRAAVFFAQLDKDIRARTKNEFTLDNVARGLMRLDNVSLADVRDISENIIKGRLKQFDSSLVK